MCDSFIRHLTQISILNATYMGTYEMQHELQNLVDIAIFK